MRPFILHRAVLSLVVCHKPLAKLSSSALFALLEVVEPHLICETFCTSSERKVLSLQDYFPEAVEKLNSDVKQDKTEHYLIQDSLRSNANQLLSALSEGRERPLGLGRKRQGAKLSSKEPPQFCVEVSCLSKNICGLGGSQPSNAQLPSKGSELAIGNVVDARGLRNDVKEPLSANDFIAILLKCKEYKDPVLVSHVQAQIRESGLETHKAVGNHLVPVLVECGTLNDAQQVFNRLVFRNVHAWTSLIVGYIQHGIYLQAIHLYEKMLADGISPSSYTLVALLKASSALKDMQRGLEAHSQVIELGFEADVFIGSTLIDMYSYSCLMAEAQQAFDKIKSRNVVAWSALIAGYAEHGDGETAFSCFEQMDVEGVLPNVVTFICVLKACSGTGVIKRGVDIHIRIVERGLEGDGFVGNILIDMYSKSGLLADARSVFDKVLVRDVSSWNAMIQGYSMNHDDEAALELFGSMQASSQRPDAVSFACILSACSRANQVAKGQKLFMTMQEVHGIEPTIDHLTCMVDLLARAGRVPEAEKLLDSSPCSPPSDMWRALLSACKKYTEIEIGERCFYKLVQIDPLNAAPYVLMRDLYLRAGRWEDASRIEELRKRTGAKKKAACASIEVNKKVHRFEVGSKESKDMARLLSLSGARATRKGHVPNLDAVLSSVSDNAKESVLCEHVEKLAIAFGLLNTSPGETIRLTKNMRMCNDCHEASKVISNVEKREIIVRDMYCVHRFKDGICSCADACIS